MSSAYTSSTPNLSSARFAMIDGVRWISIEDAVTVLGGDLWSINIGHVIQQIPEGHFKVHPLFGDSGTPEDEGVVTMYGLGCFLLSCGEPTLVSLARTLLADSLEVLAAVRLPGRPRLPGTTSGTRWGEQPFRQLLRTTYSMSVSEAVALLNKHVQPGERVITKPSFDAVASGRQLPSPSFLRCLSRVFQCAPADLLSPPAFEAFTRKHTPPPLPAPPSPTPPPSPTRTFPAYEDLPVDPSDPYGRPALPSFAPPPSESSASPVAGSGEEDDDEEFDADAYWAEQDALMDAAAAEAIGMPGVSFEAGFAAVMGSASPAPASPSDPVSQASDAPLDPED